jgi:hypothetical protein
VPDNVVAVSKNGSTEGAAIVAADTDHHETKNIELEMKTYSLQNRRTYPVLLTVRLVWNSYDCSVGVMRY